MDAARVARRLGADDTIIVYRRTREQMPAHEDEAADAEAEGIRINWLRTISSMGEGGLTVEIQELDENGRPHGTGRFETLEADTVILALGQESDTGFLHAATRGRSSTRDVVQVDRTTLMTGAPGVFAGGDAVPSERTVTVGVGHGKKAARSIDAYLRGEAFTPGPKHPLASFEMLNLWYFGDHDRRQQPERQPATRVHGFGEVVGRPVARRGSLRGAALPVLRQLLRVRRLLRRVPRGRHHPARHTGPPVRSRLDRCTGCATCYRQCPVHAIEMVAEVSRERVPGVGAIAGTAGRQQPRPLIRPEV